MKVYYLITIFFMSCFFTNAQKKNEIEIVSFLVETPKSISCDDFDKNYSDLIIKKNISTKTAELIVSNFKKLIQENKTPNSINVKYRGYINFNSEEYLFCGDESTININGKYFTSSPKLIDLLNRLLPAKQRVPKEWIYKN